MMSVFAIAGTSTRLQLAEARGPRHFLMSHGKTPLVYASSEQDADVNAVAGLASLLVTYRSLARFPKRGSPGSRTPGGENQQNSVKRAPLTVPRLEDLKHQVHVRAPHLLEGLRPRHRVEVREHERQALLP